MLRDNPFMSFHRVFPHSRNAGMVFQFVVIGMQGTASYGFCPLSGQTLYKHTSAWVIPIRPWIVEYLSAFM